MNTSNHQDQGDDDWTAGFFREIEQWFREQYECEGRNVGAGPEARRNADRALDVPVIGFGEQPEAGHALWTFRPH